MLKRRISLVLVAALVPAPYSCTKDGSFEPPSVARGAVDDAMVELERIEDELGASAEVRELMEMLESVANRMAACDLRVEDLVREPIERNGGPGRLLGYSEGECAVFGARLEALRARLLARYPVLIELVSAPVESMCDAGTPCPSGDENAIPLDPPVKGSNRVSCKWGPFVLALLACANAAVAAGGNPGVYFVCAYQVLCSYCQGGWVNRVCS
jgi:hypothetical protein